MNRIETERLLLRPWRDTDAPRAVEQAIHIDRIGTDYLVTNPASGQILERAGFLDQGESTCHSAGSGLTGPSRKMVLTKTRYLEHRAQGR